MKEQAEVLYLASSPANADRLELDREARAIQQVVEDRCPAGSDPLRVATRWAAEPLDFLREIRAVRPTVLHFAGYGARGRDGIYLQDVQGKFQFVSSSALSAAVAAAGSSIRVVVFNACYSAQQATGLLETVDCVAALGGGVQESEARTFAREFYGALAQGLPVSDAWERGLVSSGARDAPGQPVLELRVRDGVDPGQIYVRTW